MGFVCKRTQKAALYRVDGVSVDVTDLINFDFVLLDHMSDALAQLSSRLVEAPLEERFSFLSGVMTHLLEQQTPKNPMNIAVPS